MGSSLCVHIGELPWGVVRWDWEGGYPCNISAHMVPRRVSRALPNPTAALVKSSVDKPSVLTRAVQLCPFLAWVLHCTLMFFHHCHHPHSAYPSMGTVLDSGQGHFPACVSELPCLGSDLAEVSELGEGFKPQRSLR